MRPNRRAMLSMGLLLVATLAGWSSGRFVPTKASIHKLAPGGYFRKAQTEPEFTGCNQGWSVFREFVLVIDANFPDQATGVIAEIRKVTDKPIRYIFDTHYHGDHADGNMKYTQQGAIAVASERSGPLFETKGLDGFQKSQKEKPDEYGKLSYTRPTVYFPRKLIIDDGEMRVELLYFGHAHTAGDAVAWLPRQRILFTGDACVNGAFNYTGDSNTESWITVLNAMEELDPVVIAPGHGELARRDLIGTQRRYFSELRATIKKMGDGGKTLEQIKQTIDLPFYEEWTGVDVKTREENLEHVYGELFGP